MKTAKAGLSSMLHHRAFGRHLETLSVAIVDNRWPMLSLMRAMLAAIGVGRIETFEDPTVALDTMANAVPDLVIAAASMQPLSGPRLIRTMRQSSSGPLSLVPAMIMSAHARATLVEESLKAGAHQVLVLPTSASTLYRRLDWLINDDHPFELKGEHYVLAGMEERLSLSFQRPIYVPPGPLLSAAAIEEEPASILGIEKKKRIVPH